MTPEAQGAVERAAEVLATHHVAVTTVGQGFVQASYFTCTCGKRGHNHFDMVQAGAWLAMADGDTHVAEALAAANLLATPPTASHDETAADLLAAWLDRDDVAENRAADEVRARAAEVNALLAARAAAGDADLAGEL